MTTIAAEAAGRLASARRVIIKIGSALLVDPATSVLRAAWLEALAEDLAAMRARGQEVLVVTSGAIAVGRLSQGWLGRTLKIEEKQAAAAIGQIQLAHLYQQALGRHGVTIGQILVTLEDTEDRRRHLNARATLNQLLAMGVLPVINENDTVTTAEIRFGDNDRLAARVAQMVSADALVLLSDIDGLYTADPRKDPEARHLPEIGEITPTIEAMAGAAVPGISSGGMVTKLAAARIALSAGCRMVIANGKAEHPLRAVEQGARVTWFLPQANPLTARKRWIAGSIAPAGTLIVDDGAAHALAEGASLLPAGIVGIEGRFERGDAVLVRRKDGTIIARGLSAYAHDDVQRILGHKTREIETLLGYRGRDEIIHRDDLVLG
ncbi:MAG TPA: glutamate 5-kinase [Stellaceae bacterium]|nr:glutamate 5-kinase [Stellaceae bacterium]